MKKYLVFIFFLLIMQHVSAQKPPHLEPVTITEMVPVKNESQQSGGIFHADTNCLFIECRNNDSTIGYLIEPKIDWWWYPSMKGDLCKNVGLREVQQAEIVLAKTLDKRADLAQEIERVFTAPYFYQYIRQYIFYTTPPGDTCVHVNCIHIREVMPEERFFQSRMRPDLDYIHVFDGSDYFWNADLNLTQGTLLSYDINGPSINMVEGRNDEPEGLYQKKTLFYYPWPINKQYSFKQLPNAVKKAVLSQMDTTDISGYQYFSTKKALKYRVKKNGEAVSELKRYKKGDYYRIYSDTICRGFDSKGQLLYISNEKYLGRLDMKYLSHIAEIDTLMAAMERHMSALGCDFHKYGYIKWLERVGKRYVVAAIYNPPVSTDLLIAYYTIDRNGQIEGVTLIPSQRYDDE